MLDPARFGMLLYGGAVAAYLAYVGAVGGTAGVLLWPAAILHAVLLVWLLVQRDPGVGSATTKRNEQ